MKRKLLLGAGALALGIGALFIPIPGKRASSVPSAVSTAPTFAEFSDDKPNKPLAIAFIHHSCGGQLLAPEGPEAGASCIYEAHPSGGNLRPDLERAGYTVHEASYDSVLGHKTDLFDWRSKFETKMSDVLRLDRQDDRLPDGKTNQIVVFKSCFPNNQFIGEGSSPGAEDGPALTVWNAKAALASLLPSFQKHPETLFVYVTAPPIAPETPELPLYRVLARTLKGQGEPEWTQRQAAWARQFNDWVVGEDGWLSGYELKNVVVFDYYGALTRGESNLLAFPPADNSDSHPTAEGNRAAAKLFVPFLNRAVRRAGLAAADGKTANTNTHTQ